MDSNYTTIERNLLLDKLTAMYPGKNITYSALYLDELLENGDVTFPLLSADVGVNAKNKSERRLALNEVFIPTRLKLVIKKVTSGAHAQAIAWTYPNKKYFASAAGTYLEDDLWAVWNGFLSMQQQETKYEPGIETARFLQVPELQHGEYTLNNAGTAITTTRTAACASNPEDGEIMLQSFPHLHGAVSHEIKLSIPNSSTLKMKNTNANEENYVRLIMRGFLVQNKA